MLKATWLTPRDMPAGSCDRCTSSPLPSTFHSGNPKQTNMADYEERRSLLGDEDEEPSTGRRTARGPGRPMPAICDPSHLLHRVVVLLFMCFLGFGEQYTALTFLRTLNGFCGDVGLSLISYIWFKEGLLCCCPSGLMLILKKFSINVYVLCLM